MSVTLSSRQFNQDTAGAKKAAEKGPVVVTDRGKPTHVLLSYQAYRALTGSGKSLVDLLSMPPAPTNVDDEFDIPPRDKSLPRPLDLD